MDELRLAVGDCFAGGGWLADRLQSLDLAVDIPSGLLEILDLAVLLSGSPDVFDGVASAEVKMLGDRDTLDAAPVAFVVRRMVD